MLNAVKQNKTKLQNICMGCKLSLTASPVLLMDGSDDSFH